MLRLTNKQLAKIFKCSPSTIRDVLYYHKKFFVESVDFFLLEKEELREFKEGIFTRNFRVAFSLSTKRLYLWTESGALKLSKIINTDEAKIIYSQLALKYFNGKPKETAPPQIPTTEKNFEVADRLLKIAELTADKNLREKCLNAVFAMLN